MKPNDQIPYDYEAIKAIANSEAGQKLIQFLRNQGGTQMENAINEAQKGNFSQAQNLLSNLLDTPEASRLLHEMEEIHE